MQSFSKDRYVQTSTFHSGRSERGGYLHMERFNSRTITGFRDSCSSIANAGLKSDLVRKTKWTLIR